MNKIEFDIKLIEDRIKEINALPVVTDNDVKLYHRFFEKYKKLTNWVEPLI